MRDMKRWGSRLVTLTGVALIIIAIYLFMKPKIDHYYTQTDNENKLEQTDQKAKTSEKKKVEIRKDKTKMAGYLSIPDADIKTPVYPGPATPKQLDRGVSFVESNESLEDQNITIA